MKSPILGGHMVARSTNLADNQCVNLFPSIVETKDGKDVAALYMCPGLDLLATVGTGPHRASHPLSNGSAIVVSGNGVYSVSTGWVAALIGTIGTSSGSVSIIDNGPLGQVALFDGAAGYLIQSGILSTLSLPFSGPAQATYQDTFGLAYAANTQEWFQSNAGDLSVWDALNFTSADGLPDNIVALKSIHREIWVVKQNDAEIWTDQGLAGFSFGRLDGVFLHRGCAAKDSVAIGGEILFWLSRNDQGQGKVVAVEGYVAKPISNSGMEAEIATYSTISDAIGYVYEQEGESFYVLTFPTAGVTWCYTIRAGLWHKRASFSNGAFGRHPGNTYAFFNGRCVVGDYASGNLYGFNLDNPTDNGAQRKWLRSWRALKEAPNVPMRFNRLEIVMETGNQVAQGLDPQVMLRWSDDGGHLWSNMVTTSAGKAGETAKRVRFNRLGSTRKATGLDRIFELSSTDPFKVAITGADVG
jgi:hypothetical protein